MATVENFCVLWRLSALCKSVLETLMTDKILSTAMDSISTLFYAARVSIYQMLKSIDQYI